MPRKIKVKTLKTKLHNLWSLCIRTRDGYKCQWCGKENSRMEAHHIVPKGSCQNAGRYEIENGMTLCTHCHMNRVPIDPDGYIEFRNKWLADRGLNYFELRDSYCKLSIKFDEDFYNLKNDILKQELLGVKG